MNSKMSFILLLPLISMLAPIGGNNWCEKVIENGTDQYKGLRLYRKYPVNFDAKDKTTLRMFNTFGDEWEFTTDADGNITLKADTIISVSAEKIYRFGVSSITYTNQSAYLEAYNCYVKSMGNNSFITDCYGFENKRDRNTKYVNPIILKPDPRTFWENETMYVLIINRQLNRNLTYVRYSPNMEKKANSCTPTTCLIPEFIEQIDPSLLDRIDGVVDIPGWGNASAHLLLFNIDGRPRYCVTPSDVISNECNSTKDMRYLLKECFDKPIPSTPQTKQTTDQTIDDSTDPLVIVLIVLIAIAVILLIAIGVVIVCTKRKRSHKTPEAGDSSFDEKGSITLLLEKDPPKKLEILEFKEDMVP